MAYPEHHHSQNPERSASHLHPAILGARAAERAIFEQCTKRDLSHSQLEALYRESAQYLTGEAQRRQLFNRPATLTGYSLHLPPEMVMANPTSRLAVPAPLSEDEKRYSQPASVRGIFKGFRYIPGTHGDEYYLTAQIQPLPDVSDANGDFSPHAWCQVSDAMLEFPHEARAEEIERALGLIDNQQLSQSDENAIARLHQYIRAEAVAKTPLQDHLSTIALQADTLARRATFRENGQLRGAVLDLLMEELNLPRLVTIRRKPDNLYAIDEDLDIDPSTGEQLCFDLVQPRLVFDYSQKIARLCFAVLWKDELRKIPLNSIAKVIEHRQ